MASNSSVEQGYKVERKEEVGNWEPLATLQANAVTFNDNTFALNKTIYYRVFVYAGQYNSTCAENNFNSTIPQPTNLQIISNSISSVTINWQDNSNGEQGFKIERQTGGSSWEQIAILNSNITTYDDNSFQLNTTIAYRICAYYGSDNSAWAQNSFNSTIPSPSNLQITTNTITSVTLNWQDNSNGEQGFKIERQTGGSSWEQIAH